ncbi:MULTISPECIES: hypothetical protein [Pseudomonas]|jgi:hypothetical protein|uniref:hypothetical protein n=1 Tax=Pseudomonas TaxID=286 RepID=UPI0012900DBA|nr:MULTISPECIES: hypothetical protein [Pseudomonas]MBA1192628.1 hypothetical protein [Pseudomonas entomophila]MCO7575866.1 hypothetical protein [Pseudomonas protegens]MCO7581296.1 hypothetical protein [Pseudomonas chlororaphis]MCO7597679.1 hypothetical protein [Pseudomonas chlororaphis]
MNKMEYAGKIGGMVGGFKRRERQNFLIMFVKIIEMDELEIRMTSTLAKKLIAAFSGCKSISNDVLIKEFARSGNSVKQQNLDMVVHSLVKRWQDYYNEQWREAKIKIDIEADEYKKRIIEEMRPQ